MKNLILFCSFLMISSFIYGQTDPRRGFVSLSLGAGVPYGDFSNNDADNNDDAGYALTGGNVNIAFGYKLGAVLGVTAMIQGGSNPIDVEAMEDDLEDNLPGSWDVKSETFRYGTVMAGGYAAFPIGTRSSFETRLLIGVMNCTLPEMNATGTIGTSTSTFTRESKTANAGAFDVGFVFRYRISDPFSVMASADFLAAHPEFDDVETNGSISSASDIDHNVRLFNFNVGVAYLLK